MFSDLAGSTALSVRLDPEDMRDIIRVYQDACSAVVARYDGLVAKFMGDGILAYFGFPRAHEDDAERAVRAGLEIAALAPRLNSGADEPLAVRIGVATGRVVVGEVIGQGSAQEQAVVGETPNLAARLQALAEPGGVLIADSTRRLLGGAFELKDLGEQELKGFPTRTRVFAVLRETEDVSRFEAANAQRMTPFVGREPEVALLVERWRDACAGEGKVALLSGDAGIGKSRILAVLRERISDERHIAVRYQCSPHHANDAFYPIVAEIRRAAGLASVLSPEERLRPDRRHGRALGPRTQRGRAARRLPLLGAVRGPLPAAQNGTCRAEGALDRRAHRPLRGPCARGAGAGDSLKTPIGSTRRRSKSSRG